MIGAPSSGKNTASITSMFVTYLQVSVSIRLSAVDDPSAAWKQHIKGKMTGNARLAECLQP